MAGANSSLPVAKELDPDGIRVVPAHVEVNNSVNVGQLAHWVRDQFGRVDAIVNNASAPHRQRVQ